MIVAGFLIADAYLQISFASSEFLALLFAFYCAQLSFVPLVLAPPAEVRVQELTPPSLVVPYKLPALSKIKLPNPGRVPS